MYRSLAAYVSITFLIYISLYNGDKFYCSWVALAPGGGGGVVTNFSTVSIKPVSKSETRLVLLTPLINFS